MISIESLECSGELCGALSLHAQAMADLYRELNKLVMAGTNNEDAHATLFEKATSYSNWYKSRKRVANSMRQAAEASMVQPDPDETATHAGQ